MELSKVCRRLVLASALGIFGAALIQPSQSSAGTLEWDVKSNHPNRVQIAFYSRSYKREWPGHGKVWGLNDYGTHTYRLECTTGEKVCFGAWLTGSGKTYWGVGFKGKNGCEHCCYTCDENPRRQVLNP